MKPIEWQMRTLALAILNGTPPMDATYHDFDETNAVIYVAMQLVVEGGEALDLVTLCEHLHDCGRLDEIGGAKYLVSLVDFIYGAR